PTWVPLPGRGRAAHELSHAEKHVVGVGVRFRRAGAGARGLRGSARPRLSVLVLRRCDVAAGTAVVKFETVARSGTARAGVLHTRRGPVPTPAFMPVATQASVKALDAAEVERSGARMLIMNTYHLWLRPGSEVVAGLGGLHELSRWPHPIATDSGGF